MKASAKFYTVFTLKRVIPLACLWICSPASGEVTTDFSDASLSAQIQLDIPNGSLAAITLDTANDELDFTTTGNTDMWTARANAPIAWTSRPTVSAGQTWYVETFVRFNGAPDGAQRVAGITLWAGPNGTGGSSGGMDFSLGLNDWDNRGVEFQTFGGGTVGDSGIGNITATANNQSQAHLRLEVTENGASDAYAGYWRANANDPWIEFASFNSSVDNSRVGLFFKNGNSTAAAERSVSFGYFAVELMVDITDPTDSEPDGMGDNWETFYFGDLSRDGTLDFDNDGLTDLAEWQEKTRPNNADSDGDGLTDGEEVNTYATDPLDRDSDDDGFDDQEELVAGTDPNNAGSKPGPVVPQLSMVAPPEVRDSVVVFNEIQFHPAGDDLSLEYIEFYNQMAVDVDMSNWRIGGVGYDFPEGTVIGAGDYLVVAKDTANYPGALGPYSGTLSNSGETLRLYNNNRSFRSSGGAGPTGAILDSLEGRRIMDEISYQDVYPWPEGPDGSGATLAKRERMTGSGHPANWRASREANGTPGTENIFGALPKLVFNEMSAATDVNFRVELHNHGTATVALGGMVVASSDPLHPDYILPTGNLTPGGFLTIDASALGYTPADNNRLFLFTVGKATLVDSARVDDLATARFPDGTGRWMRPDTATFNAANSVPLENDIVINEIFYHAYPQHAMPGVPPTYSDLHVLNYDAVWRYNLDAGTAGLPSNWAASAHTVDNVSWSQGAGLLAVEVTALAETINTTLTLEAKIPYYFETEFAYNNPAVIDQMVISHYVDDGAVFYLNGVEIGRVNMPGGPITPATIADPGVPNAVLGNLTIQNPTILQGINRLSVEVHQVGATSTDIVLGTQVILRSFLTPGTPGTPYAEGEEEWLEIYNRGSSPVNLTGWKIDGGISYNFPVNTTLAAGEYLVVAKNAGTLSTKHPAASILGNYSGRLGNGGDLITLIDAVGNPADEVAYLDSGKWHEAADAGGSSLELIDPDSDNRSASAWAPSNESPNSTWQTYTYEAVAFSDGIGNNVYHEFILGLLDSGELLLDDVSVLENNSVEMIQNGDFESDTLGQPAATWRAIGTHGNHGRTLVVDDNGNKCLHVVATAATEDKHNKLETTFANGETIVPGNTYRISFRAKWISGSNQVNTRLYFNYLQRTIPIAVPEKWGTPGLVNSAAVQNLGPTMHGLTQLPVVPAANTPTTVAIRAADPDGIAILTLHYSVNAGAFLTAPMTEDAGDIFTGTIPGQSSSSIVRFYVEALDNSSAATTYPADGPNAGAFFKVQDGLADNTGLRHNFRVVMAKSDRAKLFLNHNRMSNDRFPVTVIEDEKTVYYDVGLRLKASASGRFGAGGYGFNIRFQPDERFRGVHDTISIERNGFLKELMAKHLMNRAGGGYWSFYDDVANIITPTTGDRSMGLLSMSRHTNTFFDGLFPNATESGTLFNHELLYNPNGTTGGAEGFKIGNPYNHTNGMYDLTNRGDSPEPYRWGFQLRNERDQDDYSEIIALNKAMDLTGTALKEALDELIDVDQWMRTFAMMSLNGTDDVYGRLYEHNFRFYVRPTDRKIIVLQWDLDRAFNLASNASVISNKNNVIKLFGIPQYRRLFDGHLDDLIDTTFNSAYTTPWATHFSTVTSQNLSGLPAYMTNRANFVQGTLPAALNFEITTNSGADFSEADSVISLEGNAWVDVFSIHVNGIPTQATWTDADSWQLVLPIGAGPNLLTVIAFNNHGLEVGSDTITVTNTSAIDLANVSNTIISELHYHPAAPSQPEIDAGYNDTDMFEFIELTNTGVNPIDLTNVAFTDGITFTFPVSTTLAPGARLILVSNQAAFEFRYGAGGIAGQFTGNLRNSGERIRLQAADTTVIADFTYGDNIPWPNNADGDGYSLIFVGGDPNHPLDWRTSTDIGGNPSSSDSSKFAGGDLIAYAITSGPEIFPLPTIVTPSTLTFTQNLAADDAEVFVEFSTDLITWTTATHSDLVSRTNQGDGTSVVTYQYIPAGERLFGHLRVQTR